MKKMEQCVLLHLEVPEMRTCSIYWKTETLIKKKNKKNPTFRHALEY